MHEFDLPAAESQDLRSDHAPEPHPIPQKTPRRHDSARDCPATTACGQNVTMSISCSRRRRPPRSELSRGRISSGGTGRAETRRDADSINPDAWRDSAPSRTQDRLRISGHRRQKAAGRGDRRWTRRVPCIVHDVDDEGAARLRTAEAIRGEAASDLRAVIGARLGDSISEMAGDLSRLQTTLALLAGSSMPFQKTVAIDLLAAQAWRTLWSAQLASLLAAPPAADVRRRPLAAVVDDVLRHFEPECRLSRLRLSAAYHGGASVKVDGAIIGFALTGAIIITMSLLDRCVEPTVEVHGHRLGDEGVWLEVVQRHCLIAKEAVAQFSSRAFSAPGPAAWR